MNLVIHTFTIRGFIQVLWGASISYTRPNFKVCYLRRNVSRLIREYDADDKLSIREFWLQFNIKMATDMFPVLRVFVTRGDLQERNPRV
jgi:hypothetical protein